MTAAEQLNEIYFSTVLGNTVIDQQGRELGKLWDLVMVPGEIFPEVSHLLVRRGQEVTSFPWASVTLFNRFVISVKGRSEGSAYEEREGEILVRRDILDQQIVDVNGAKVVRVNDLKLGGLKEKLCIVASDIGFLGILRRLGHLRLWEKVSKLTGKEIKENEIGWQYVQPLDSNTSRLTLTGARDQMAEMHPADLAEIMSQISHRDIETVLTSVDAETAGEALHEMEPELRSLVISQLDTETASDIIEEMDPDEAADVLADLPEEKQEELLNKMDAEEREEILELMEHEEDTAGALMNSEFVSLTPDLTVEEALKEVRLLAPEVDNIYYAYVMDAEEHLLGVVSIKEILTASPETPVSEVMGTHLKTVSVGDEPEEILEIIAKYDLVAVPVLDEEGKMAGIVTVEDIIEMFLPYALKRKRHRHH